MAQAMAGFPRELNAHLHDSLDRTYWLTFAINFILFFGMFGYLQSLPPKVMTEEKLRAYYQALYTYTREAPEPVANATPEPAAPVAGETLDVEPLSANDLREMTLAELQAQREAARQVQHANMAAEEERARDNALFTAAGGANRGNNGARGHNVQRLTGGVNGTDMGTLQGLARNNNEADRVQTLRANGALLDGSNGAAGHELSLAEINIKAAADTSVVINVPEGPDSRSGSGSRSRAGIAAFVQSQTNSLRFCYNSQLRQDPRLGGTLKVSFVITPGGTVQNAQVMNRKWNNEPLGRQVERCILDRVRRWQFPQAGGGAYSFDFSMTFINGR